MAQRADALKLQSRLLAATSRKESARGYSRYGLLLAQEAFKPLQASELPPAQWPADAEVALHAAVTATTPSRSLAKFSDRPSKTIISPDANLVAAMTDNVVRIRDRSGKLIREIQHEDSIKVFAFSRDSKQLVTASDDGTAKIWDAYTGQEILALQGYTGSVISVAFSPDGQGLATGSEDRQIKLWDVNARRERLTMKGHTNSVRTVAFSHDGARLVSEGMDENHEPLSVGNNFVNEGLKAMNWDDLEKEIEDNVSDLDDTDFDSDTR